MSASVLAVPGPDDKPDAAKRAAIITKARAAFPGLTLGMLNGVLKAGMTRREMRDALIPLARSLTKGG